MSPITTLPGPPRLSDYAVSVQVGGETYDLSADSDLYLICRRGRWHLADITGDSQTGALIASDTPETPFSLTLTGPELSAADQQAWADWRAEMLRLTRRNSEETGR